jgi:hypothetical protein
MDGKEAAHIAHIRMRGKQPVRQRMVSRHVGYLHHQHEIRAGRHAIALQHGGLARRQCLEFRLSFRALVIERDFDDRGQHGADLVRRHDRDLALDHAGIDQALDAAQASRRRRMHACRKLVIGPRCIALQCIEDAAV